MLRKSIILPVFSKAHELSVFLLTAIKPGTIFETQRHREHKDRNACDSGNLCFSSSE